MEIIKSKTFLENQVIKSIESIGGKKKKNSRYTNLAIDEDNRKLLRSKTRAEKIDLASQTSSIFFYHKSSAKEEAREEILTYTVCRLKSRLAYRRYSR